MRQDLSASEDVTRLVRRGYDQVALAYDQWSPSDNDPRLRMITAALAEADRSGVVVDLGCGAGRSATWIQNFGLVIGVDVSSSQLRVARRRVPVAQLIQADLASVAFRAGTVAAVICLYALFHVPRSRHQLVLSAIGSWLLSGGKVLLNVGANDNPGAIEPDWLGVPMYWSNFGPETTCSLVERAGLLIDWTDTVTEGSERLFWVAARKP